MTATTNNVNQHRESADGKRRRTLAYVRSATIDKRDLHDKKFASTAGRQEQQIRGWAASNDCVIDAVYSDEGVSGIRRDRPGLDRLFRRLDQLHTTDSGDEVLVVMTDPARLARNMPLDMELLDAIAARGANVVFTDVHGIGATGELRREEAR